MSKPVAVITTNRSELLYMVSWCEDNDQGTPFLGEPAKYPIMICVGEERASWLDRLDRNIEYIEFRNFI